MSDKVDVSCQSCEADYTLRHDLLPPYRHSFCAFCGEEFPVDEFIIDRDEDDDDLPDW